MRIVQSLQTFLEKHFLQAKQRNSKAIVRPVLIGPPGDILQSIFDNLTNKGSSEWILSSKDRVAVLLILGSKIRRDISYSQDQLSRECHWDYAVNVRNSYPLVLMLVDPTAWDSCPESLVNTTEVLGFLQPSPSGKWFSNSLWQNLIQQISVNLDIEPGKIKDALSRLIKESDYHDIPTKNRFLWEIADDLLNTRPNLLVKEDVLAFKVGFPSLGKTPRTITESDKVLKRLADFFKRLGLLEGIDKLKNTQIAISLNLQTYLDDFKNHIYQKSLSGVNFSYSPIWHYRSSQPIPDWWKTLTVDIWETLLEDTGDKPQAQLSLSCENALNKKEPLLKEPLIVVKEVQLKATPSDGLPVKNIKFQRRLPLRSIVTLAPVPGDETGCIDKEWIPHDKPIKYTCDAQGFRTGSVEVLILNSFGCRGTVHIRDAENNPPPSKFKKQNIWRQEIILPRGGAIDIDIYHVDSVEGVRLSGGSLQGPIEKNSSLGQSKTSFVVVIEGETNFKVTLLTGSGAIDSEWEVSLTIQETNEIARTRFDALVSAHKGTGKLPVPNIPDSPLLRIEDNYLGAPESWRTIVACWTNTTTIVSKVDWKNPRLGDIEPKLGLPPNIEIPDALSKAREEIRLYLVDKKRYVEEVELNDPALGSLIEDYLTSYLSWLNDAPDKATWMDCIAIYSAKKNPQAGDYSSSDEPVAIVLSPLHPIKIGWQALAQQYLASSLSQTRCPAAGLLNPSKCPDIGGWAIKITGSNVAFRAFLAVPCDNPYWGFLWNKKYLNDENEKISVLHHLQEIGLETQSITGGFSRSQAVQSIDDVSRLLPGRATLRIGIIGAKDSSSALSDGVIEWCKKQFGEDTPEYPGSINVEIYDMRGAIQPTPGVLAVLSEQTQEKARWFRIENVPLDSQLDLVILDQLGSSSLTADQGSGRSVLGIGGLYRSRIRQDFEGADLVMETRVGNRTNNYGGLDGLLRETIVFFEALASRDGGTTHFRFRPNQQAIGNRLQQSTYLAITSSQLDPGGIIRGVTGQEGYLWDYELPGMLGGNEESAGYYLLAKPLDSMRDAIRNSASIITNTGISQKEIQLLIEEISRRGIPVLKRLASGGTQSRGELGLLLGTRLLQDVFIPDKPTNGLPVWCGNCIHLVLPVDPFDEPFEKIRGPLCGSKTSPKRPDLLMVAINIPSDEPEIAIKITPIEVKFRGNTMSLSQMQEALDQASNLGQVLDAAWAQSPINDLWDVCCRALMTECLDFAFRIYANPDIHKHSESEWANIHEIVLEKILNKEASITINSSGRLLVFDQSNKTSLIDVDNDGRLDTVVICPADSTELLTGLKGLIKSNNITKALDLSFPSCICHKDKGEYDEIVSDISLEVEKKSIVQELETPVGGEAQQSTKNYLLQPFESTAPTDHSSLIPVEVRNQVNNAFIGFIGNDAVVKRIKNDLLSALIEKPPHLSKNFMFYGEPSTGKTELARRIATALQLPFVKLDGRGLVSRERLFELVNGELTQQGLSPSQVGQQTGLPLLEYPPLIIFVDEVHLTPKSIQESLLTVLEAVDRTVTMKNFVARMNKTTFLFATTRPSEVDKAFRSRCADVSLREYTIEEVAEMLKRRFSKAWPEHVFLQLAKLGRRVPRVAISLAMDLETTIKVSDNPTMSIDEQLDDVRKTHEMDNLGLKPLDFQYLETLRDEGKPVGEQAIVNLLATADKDRVIDEVEPFLRKLGFIRFGSRGREITEKGMNYLLDIEKGKGAV